MSTEFTDKFAEARSRLWLALMPLVGINRRTSRENLTTTETIYAEYHVPLVAPWDKEWWLVAIEEDIAGVRMLTLHLFPSSVQGLFEEGAKAHLAERMMTVRIVLREDAQFKEQRRAGWYFDLNLPTELYQALNKTITDIAYVDVGLPAAAMAGAV